MQDEGGILCGATVFLHKFIYLTIVKFEYFGLAAETAGA